MRSGRVCAGWVRRSSGQMAVRAVHKICLIFIRRADLCRDVFKHPTGLIRNSSLHNEQMHKFTNKTKSRSDRFQLPLSCFTSGKNRELLHKFTWNTYVGRFWWINTGADSLIQGRFFWGIFCSGAGPIIKVHSVLLKERHTPTSNREILSQVKTSENRQHLKAAVWFSWLWKKTLFTSHCVICIKLSHSMEKVLLCKSQEQEGRFEQYSTAVIII